jgi:hypothetical protein
MKREKVQRFLKSPLHNQDEYLMYQYEYVLEEFQRTNPNFNLQFQLHIP